MAPRAPIGQRLRWSGLEDGFSPEGEPADIRIVDSWRVSDGRARGLELHAARFRSACADLYGVSVATTTAFLQAAFERVPSQGQWFPRVELALRAGMPQFALWLRPSPPLGETVRLWISDEPDRRARPDVKGFDLDRLALLRQRAIDAGADEALILARDGSVCEGSTTSILWWRADTLCAPPATPRLLGGVTRSLLLEATAAAGQQIAYEHATPRDLDALEVWAVNALHGIRPVTRWIGAPVRAGPAAHAHHWRTRLDGLAVPTRTHAASAPIVTAAHEIPEERHECQPRTRTNDARPSNATSCSA